MFVRCILYQAGKCLEYANYEDINDYFLIDEDDDEIETDPDEDDDDDEKDIPTDPDVISGWIYTVGIIIFTIIVLYCLCCSGRDGDSVASSSYASDTEHGKSSKASYSAAKKSAGLMDKFKQNVKKSFDVALDTDSDGNGVPPAPSAAGFSFQTKKRGFKNFFKPRTPKKDYMPLSAEEESMNQTIQSYQN
ncbi:Oidioi.mRNA.OKI2018_I69.chr2.g5298.t1.cds [Oikopleura dioica]|uniref:Oidioi.mRNA.OKI2018_I69.chr2.g5298.t1.cds n=1 Tax=Oikopleura dioica TaxID=34765 RepID=A0ABN7T0G1_OIKDI|nr:Oidioi.mRNA.OKI2018_I69.chr2.g5298.t1.cds [Oikopleura dioica]